MIGGGNYPSVRASSISVQPPSGAVVVIKFFIDSVSIYISVSVLNHTEQSVRWLLLNVLTKFLGNLSRRIRMSIVIT